MTSDISFLYVTAPNPNSAEDIVKTLLSEKLIACANVFPGIQSLYWWEDQIQKDSEVVIIMKSKKEKLSELRLRIEKLHPYKVPCIAELSIASMNQKYQEWLLQNL